MKKNLFDPTTQMETLERIRQFQPDASRQWGKMTPGQAICHLSDPLRDVLNLRNKKSVVPRIFQPLIRMMLITEKDWGKNAPTFKTYRQGEGGNGTPPTEFAADKATLVKLIEEFCGKGPDYMFGPHAGIGRANREQLGIFMWKHVDHHLRQFGL